MEELISVIIPVYNGEKYIGRMIEFVLNQTHENFELLIINDGSKDDTEKEVRKFADDRIKLYNKENTGVSDTRNFGVQKSIGNYIAFLDADDTICPTYLERLYIKMKEDNSDIVFCEYNKVIDEKVIFSNSLNGIENLNTLEDKKKYISLLINNQSNRNAWGVVWRTLFKRDIVEDLLFDRNIAICEDMLFLIEAIMKAGNISIIKDSLYNYYIYNQSVLGKERRTYDETLFLKWSYFYGKINELLKKTDIYDDIMYDYKFALFNNYIGILNKVFFKQEERKKSFIFNCKQIKHAIGEEYVGFKMPFKMKIVHFFIRHKLYRTLYLICVCKNKIKKIL